MKFIAAVIFLACLAVGNALFPKALQDRWGYLDSEEFAKSHPKVIGGDNCNDGQVPWQISLQYLQWGIIWSHICGGSLISPNTVITAAHCTDGGSASQYKIRYGTLKRSSSPNADITVSRIIQHPSWNTNTIDYDYSLLILSSPITPGTNAAVVPLGDSDPADGTECNISGWGLTVGGSSTLPEDMKCATMSILGRSGCNDIWGSVNAVTDNMVCMIHGTKSACNGDSGGPMTINGVLHGVCSWGPSNCPPGQYPTVYASVAAGNQWIKNNMV